MCDLWNFRIIWDFLQNPSSSIFNDFRWWRMKYSWSITRASGQLNYTPKRSPGRLLNIYVKKSESFWKRFNITINFFIYTRISILLNCEKTCILIIMSLTLRVTLRFLSGNSIKTLLAHVWRLLSDISHRSITTLLIPHLNV